MDTLSEAAALLNLAGVRLKSHRRPQRGDFDSPSHGTGGISIIEAANFKTQYISSLSSAALPAMDSRSDHLVLLDTHKAYAFEL